MRRRHAASDARDRGSAAVEFALLLPVLLLIIFGVIDFGRAINAQITLTQAAREGARLASLGYTTSAVQTRAQNAATGLSPVTVSVTTSCPTGAGAGVDAVVQTSYQFSFITPVGAFASMFGSASFGSSTLTLTAKGEMPCETLSPGGPDRCSGCSAATIAGWSASSSGCSSAPCCWGWEPW
jgi:Flp pilus assembly protein TadG